MASYAQGVPTVADPAADTRTLRRTESRTVAYPNTGPTLTLPVYRWSGTAWVKQ